MNAQNIDWTQAPEGYDYYIVDKNGNQDADFHYLSGQMILGRVTYTDQYGKMWLEDPDEIEVYKRPEQSAKPVVTHLRCIEADNTASHFTVGKTYEVLETTPQTGSHSIKDDFGSTVYINGKTLEFVGRPSIGAFEVVSEESAVASDESKMASDEFNDEPYEFDTASEEPEQDQGCVVTHLRCISSDESDDSFSVGTVYEVLNPTEDDGTYMLLGDDDSRWAIDAENLEFIGSPEIGTFEIAKVGDSVKPEPKKTGPVFGDMVHIGGTPFVFIYIDGDGDHVLKNSSGDTEYVDLHQIDEYTTQSPMKKFREDVLYQLETLFGTPLMDTHSCSSRVSIAELIDFIIDHKDTWQ